MLQTNEILNTLRQIELKRKRLNVTNDEFKLALGVHINTLMSWKTSGYQKLQVCDLIALLDFLKDVDQRGKATVMTEVYNAKSIENSEVDNSKSIENFESLALV